MKKLVLGCAVAAGLLAAGVLCGPAFADGADAAFDPQALFAPLSLPDAANGFRDGAGKPGPLFWQNRVDYAIQAEIDPATHTLRGDETITYTNHSPDALDVLWVQLDQNIYRRDSRGSLSSPRARNDFTDGYQIDAVEVDGKPVRFLIDDTRLRVDLAQALAGSGMQAKLRIRYHYTVPGTWGGRTAVTPTKNGDIYEIAQWFPRMAVYDDLRGWDTQPYLGSEFYLEYGDIDYAVTVPWNYLVAGSGALTNASEVLTATQQKRLAQAAQSDRTVMIRSPQEVNDPASRPKQSGTQTWRFHMEHTRDIAFAASPAFVWDAARINLPEGKHALAMSVYPVEGVGKDKWDRSSEYVKGAIEHFSSKWYPYPWPVAVNLGGHGAGMEYPGIVFDGYRRQGPDAVLDHRARNRPHLVPDGGGLQRAPQRVHGRRLQHLHRRVCIGCVQQGRVCAQARQRIRAQGRQSGRRDPAAAGRCECADADGAGRFGRGEVPPPGELLQGRAGLGAVARADPRARSVSIRPSASTSPPGRITIPRRRISSAS